MKLLPSWDALLKEHWEQIKTSNVVRPDSYKPSQNTRTLGLLFKIPPESSQKIKDRLDKTIPNPLKKKILLQPWQGYHLTVQWSPERETTKIKMGQFTKTLESYFSKISPIRAKIVFPFFGVVGLLGLLKTEKNREFLEIRKRANEVWKSFGLTLGAQGYLEKYPDLAYLSLSRYIDIFNSREKNLLKNLQVSQVKNVYFDEALLVLNDKFMTPEKTEILYRLSLGKSN